MRAAEPAISDTVRNLLEGIRAELDRRGIESEKIFNATYSLEMIFQAHVLPEPDGVAWREYGLTKSQSRLASLLHTKLGQVVTREAMLNGIYFDCPDETAEPKILDVWVMKIRRAITAHRLPFIIESVWGDGYAMYPAELQVVKKPRNSPALQALKVA